MWIWVSLILVVLIWDYFNKKHRNDVFRESGITGPPALPLVGCALEVTKVSSEKLIPFVSGNFKKYGNTFRMWVLNESLVFTSDMNIMEAIFNSTTLLTKGDFYNIVRPWLGDGLLLSTGAKWHARRKALTPAFHFNILENYMKVFNEQSQILVDKLKPVADGITAVDMAAHICLTALDVITECATGVKVNAQRNPTSSYTKALKAVDEILPGRLLNFIQRFDWSFRLTAPKLHQTVEHGIKTMKTFTIDIIEERRRTLNDAIANGTYEPFNIEDKESAKKRQMSLLDILLHTKIDGKPLSNEDICEEVDTFVFAGDDTTTSATSHSLYYIARHPEVQKKLVEEIVGVIGKDPHVPVTINDLHELSYLNCVVKETLRLCPPAPAIGRKTMEDIELNGVKIPANTSIYTLLYFSHRDPKYFTNPDSFMPDRFIDFDDSNSRYSIFAYTPFSAGSRNCIGQKFAILEIKTILTKILRNYELLPLGPDIKPMITFVLRSTTGAHVGLRPRVYDS